MGMAASQARLLSITSRMSDNELRSQLINNAKMRLTTDSSRASEKYLAALNATQLMFSNYTTTGESQFQQLTFNSLTAYSAYNNQYGLANRGGELLVSEVDSAKYEEAFAKANADLSIEEGDVDARNAKALEEFLKSYGLVKDTTYFEKEALYTDIDPKIKEMYEGDMVFEYHSTGGGVNGTDPYAMRVSGIHYGYEESLKSKDYGIYDTLLDNYQSAKTVWNQITTQSRQGYVEMLTGKDAGATKYEDAYDDFLAYANNICYEYDEETGAFKNFVDEDGNHLNANEVLGTALEYQYLMQDYYKQINDDSKYAPKPTTVGDIRVPIKNNCNDESDAFHRRMQFYLDLTYGAGSKYQDPATQAYKRDGFTPGTLTNGPDDNNDGIPDYMYYVVSENEIADNPITTPEQALTHEYQTGTDEEGNPITTNVPIYEVIERTMDDGEYFQSMIDMYRFFQGEVLGSLAEGAFRAEYIENIGAEAAKKDGEGARGAAETRAGEKYDKAQADYDKASKELSFFIFGQDIGEEYYDKLDDMEWIIYGELIDPLDPNSGRTNTPLFATTALDGSEGGVVYDMNFPVAGSLDSEELPYPANFQAVKDVYLCEKMMELYGTPHYTWIDTTNRDENGEKKAAWYTNLFNRMVEGGYETIEDGLASSPEWLKFALESGLLTMEQVDIKDKWMSMTYLNNANITESQIDIDITVAEAEYNKTMQEIEAKDKRFDMELKNIDTEHQSLQTEYDSIKSVIDKNVARNFKMFEA